MASANVNVLSQDLQFLVKKRCSRVLNSTTRCIHRTTMSKVSVLSQHLHENVVFLVFEQHCVGCGTTFRAIEDLGLGRPSRHSSSLNVHVQTFAPKLVRSIRRSFSKYRIFLSQRESVGTNSRIEPSRIGFKPRSIETQSDIPTRRDPYVIQKRWRNRRRCGPPRWRRRNLAETCARAPVPLGL